MQRKLAELIVEVEAAQALVFDGYLGPRLRIGAPLIKLRAARLGITAASDAIEIHGGNGYIEQWPVARLLRDAQVNTVWEGPDNILCLDVRRAIERDGADQPFLDRLRRGRRAGRRPTTPPPPTGRRERIDDLERAIAALARARPADGGGAPVPARPVHDRRVRRRAAARAGRLRAGGARLRPQAARRRLYVRAHLADHGPLRGIDCRRRSCNGSRTSATAPSSTSGSRSRYAAVDGRRPRTSAERDERRPPLAGPC